MADNPTETSDFAPLEPCAQQPYNPLDRRFFSCDDFLGGRLKIWQPIKGYRIAIDTPLLAASVPAKSGETVMEGGIGTAGAALCLAARVPGCHITGLEREAETAHLARHNIDYNGFEASIIVQQASITTLEGKAGQFDHIMINPPYLAEGTGIAPPDRMKSRAHMAHDTSLKDWVRFCLYHAKHKGTISIILRADRLDELISLLYRRVGDIHILPLWPRMGERAKRVLVQARKGTRGVTVLLPGMALHGAASRYSPALEAICLHGKALDLQGKIF